MSHGSKQRRDLIVLWGVIVITVAFAFFLYAIHDGDEAGATRPTKTTVVVIGAGAAGIGAAQTLDSNGVEFIVLEAQSALGGRVKKQTWNDMVVEMGANWISGHTDNDFLWGDATDLDIKGKVTDWDAYEMVDVDTNGIAANVDKADADEIRDNFYDVFYDDCWVEQEELAALVWDETHTWEELDINVMECLQENYGASTVFQDYKDNTDNLDARILDHFVFSSVDLEYTADVHELSLLGAFPLNGQMGESSYMVADPRGFASILEKKAEPFEDRIHYQAEVKSVEEENGGGSMRVTTMNGDTYSADYVISTLPLGVMHNRRVEFEPDLPADKWEAIDRMEMGVFTKVFIQFTEKFWDDVDIVRLTSSPNAVVDDPELLKYKWAVSLDEPNYIEGSRALMFAVIGEDGKRVEEQDVAVTKAEVVAALQLHYPDATVEATGDVLVSDWWSNPLFGGAYSVWTVGFTDLDWYRIREPEGRVHFAGEHTEGIYSAYVHGGLRSGQLEADEVVNRLNGIEPGDDDDYYK